MHACCKNGYSTKIKSAKTFLKALPRKFIPSKYTRYTVCIAGNFRMVESRNFRPKLLTKISWHNRFYVTMLSCTNNKWVMGASCKKNSPTKITRDIPPPLVCPLTCSVVSEPPPALVNSPDLQQPLTPDCDDAQTLSEWLNWKHTL